MKRLTKLVMAAMVATTARAGVVRSQANDPSARLKEVLPASVAEHVLATIAAARAHDLPAAALENRALKFAARGVAPKDIEKAIDEQADRMASGRDALEAARSKKPTGDEVDAAAEAIRKGVDGRSVSELAKSAPSGRSVAVPLYVIGSLIDRGLPSAEALKRVRDRLQARASDNDLEQLAGLSQDAPGLANKPAETGRALAGTKRPASAGGAAGNGSPGGGPPAGVPANGGRGSAPNPHKPTTPPGKKP
ncbi:MAG TPA: hypothetical protein VNS10_14050 [Gemmatimonadaceae bacterium]|nr:hypothetical protein [Gemmatimonadaceae bacterium]